MKKKLFACLMAAVIILSLFSAAAFAQTDVNLGRQDGRLTITEPGSYVLQGKLTGQVYVDPREGDVELVLDGADIDGGAGGGIVAVSGDSLTLRLPEGCQIELTADRPLHLSGLLEGLPPLSWLLAFTDEDAEDRLLITRHYAALLRG